MRSREKKITQAWLESPTRGIIELATDWRARYLPPISLGVRGPRLTAFERLPDLVFARKSAFFVNHHREEINFVLWLDQIPAWITDDGTSTPRVPEVYIAGDFNGWQNAVGKPEWQLKLTHLDGADVLLWSGKASSFFATPPIRFKFVTGEHQWLDVPVDAVNGVRDETGNTNRQVDSTRTGNHLFQFTVAEPLNLASQVVVHWQNEEMATLRPGDFFLKLSSDKTLGAIVLGGDTVFRIFAPRATHVELRISNDLTRLEAAHRYNLKRNGDYVWEITLTQNLHGWYYWYHMDGPKNEFTHFNPAFRILDPYALATVERLGPGIVIDRKQIAQIDHSFKTPNWQDLVIVEAHVRDLAAKAPVDLTAAERRGFSGLLKWVESPDFYLHRLGVNAVELQPIQECDNATPTDYHWGYMTNNYFAPESTYALDPAKASGIEEFQKLVAAFHKRGMAVILDVVYNHVGEPAHLLYIDPLTYFHVNVDGSLSNWSGCGNDINADTAMARRLIIDSCTHLIETFGIDGFRFDLAEIVGYDALVEIEKALKQVKSDVILISEPWSFKGHIAGALRDTGWASWNDGYRNFIREFVRGGGSHESYEYNLKGSPWHFAKWPAQTINYSESHDDRCWLDVITENPNNNGQIPTSTDKLRTHLMASILFMSIGVPMLSAGQDFLRSKQGVNNTYLRGDLNALDYGRIQRFPSTHAYFAEWIAFRRSKAGALLRQYSRPRDEFFRFFFASNSTAAATLYNADCEQGPQRLLFAVNPTLSDASVPIGREIASLPWRQIADQERFYTGNAPRPYGTLDANLFLPPLSCVLWQTH